MRNFRLRERRKALGLTQMQLAALRFPWRIHQAAVSRAEAHPAENPGDVANLRRAIVLLELDRRAERLNAARRWLDDERARVARQEALWAALPDSPAKAALQEAMLERCLDLMHVGRGEECDAIAEWLPPAEVRRMFDRWEIETQADRLCAFCRPEPLACPPA
jgi:hypothetical protein